MRISEGHAHLLPPNEVLQRLKDSPRQYDIGSANAAFSDAERQSLAVSFWGTSAAAYVPVVTTDASGTTRVSEAKTSPEVQALLDQAEAPYWKKDYAAAEALYARALAIDPHDYHARVAHAECVGFQGHLDEALREYDETIALNPAAHVAWEYKGELLLAMHRREEALDAYAHALALRPRWEPLLKHLRDRADGLGIQIASERLLPAVRVSKTENGARIEFDPSHPEWLAFGACKALWLGEPDHRKEVTGSPEHIVTSSEERECLGGMLSMYATLREEKKSSDPKLDEAVEIVKNGASDELLNYEVFSRVDGNFAAQLPPALLDKLVRYVRWYVLVDRRVSVR